MPSSGLRGHCMRVIHIHIRGKTFIHIKVSFFILLYMITLSLSSDTPKRGNQIPLQMVVSHHVVAGIELRTSRRAVSALNCQAISPTRPVVLVLLFLRQGLLCSPGWPGTHRDPPASASECWDLRCTPPCCTSAIGPVINLNAALTLEWLCHGAGVPSCEPSRG